MVYVLRHPVALLRTDSHHRLLFPRAQVHPRNTCTLWANIHREFARLYCRRSMDGKTGAMIMDKGNWLVVGISGATCSGKSTVAKEIHSLFVNSILIHQDDYFHDPSSEKHTRITELNHINFEILSSVDMESMKKRIRSVLETENWIDDFKRRRTMLENKFKQRFESCEIVPAIECLFNKIRNIKNIPNILILDGFLLFNDDELFELCDLRFYFTIEKATCWERRKVRTYDPPDVPGYFDKYVWPHYLIHYEDVLKKSSDIKFVDGGDSIQNNFKSVLHKLLIYLS